MTATKEQRAEFVDQLIGFILDYIDAEDFVEMFNNIDVQLITEEFSTKFRQLVNSERERQEFDNEEDDEDDD